MKWLQLVFAALFTLFAYFQINDPDFLIWVMVYLGVAELFAFSWFGKRNRDLTLGIMILVLGGAMAHLPGLVHFFFNDDGITFNQGMSNTYPYIEQAREFGGLLLAGLSLLWLYRQQSS